jgi:hypothetical protein
LIARGDTLRQFGQVTPAIRTRARRRTCSRAMPSPVLRNMSTLALNLPMMSFEVFAGAPIVNQDDAS